MSRRVAGIVVGALAATAVLVGILGLPWWTSPEGYDKYGVRSEEACYPPLLSYKAVEPADGHLSRGAECKVRSLEDVAENSEKTWVTFGSVTFFVGIAAGGALLLGALLTALGVGAVRTVSPGRIAAGLSLAVLLCGTAFFAIHPAARELRLAAGFPLTALGGVAGVFAGVTRWTTAPRERA